MLEYSNLDVKNVVTPVDPKCLEQLLIQTGYDSNKTEFSQMGFQLGMKGTWMLSEPHLT